MPASTCPEAGGRHYVRFPEVRIETAHRPRVPRMLAEVTDALNGYDQAEVQAFDQGLGVAVTWESAFLANPTSAVWVPVSHPARLEPLLASAVSGGHGPTGRARPQAPEG